MSREQVIEVLGYANGNECAVRLIMSGGGSVVGVPSSVDLHPTANEVYLRPMEDDSTEIAISLTSIISAELIN